MMRMHEFLWIVQGLHDFSERAAENKGQWLWPTMELLSENIYANREVVAPGGFRRRLYEARECGWLTVGPCTGHCHARHIIVTSLGAAHLAAMTQQGCTPVCACAERVEHLHLERRLRRAA